VINFLRTRRLQKVLRNKKLQALEESVPLFDLLIRNELCAKKVSQKKTKNKGANRKGVRFDRSASATDDLMVV